MLSGHRGHEAPKYLCQKPMRFLAPATSLFRHFRARPAGRPKTSQQAIRWSSQPFCSRMSECPAAIYVVCGSTSGLHIVKRSSDLGPPPPGGPHSGFTSGKGWREAHAPGLFVSGRSTCWARRIIAKHTSRVCSTAGPFWHLHPRLPRHQTCGPEKRCSIIIWGCHGPSNGGCNG